MLNEKEMNVFVFGVCENDYNKGDITKPILSDFVEECYNEKGFGFEKENIFVILNNIIKKGYLSTDGDYIWLTNKGIKLYNETVERMVA